jgi:hypothetical protein
MKKKIKWHRLQNKFKKNKANREIEKLKTPVGESTFHFEEEIFPRGVAERIFDERCTQIFGWKGGLLETKGPGDVDLYRKRGVK